MKVLVACEESQEVCKAFRKLGHDAYSCDIQEPLKPTEIVEERESTKVPGNWFNKGGKERQINRAKTFPGIARAMAEQWGSLFND